MKPILVPYDENMTKEELLKEIADAVGSDVETVKKELCEPKDEPQTDCDKCKWYDTGLCWSKIDSDDHSCHYEPKDEPQTERHLPDYSYEADLGRRIMEQTERSGE